MQRFKTLSDFLTPDHHPDYWSDSAVLIAMEMIADLQPDDWEELEQAWAGQNSGWQMRLADALSDGPAEKGFPILKEMLRSQSEKVALEAGNSIYGLLQSGFAGKLDVEEVQILKSLA